VVNVVKRPSELLFLRVTMIAPYANAADAHAPTVNQR